jgi:hypothetical protein
MRAIAAAVLALGLCACGGASGAVSGGGSVSASGAGTSAAVTVGGSASTSGSVTATPAGTTNGALSAQDLCAFLDQEAPKLESVGSAVGALAQLTGDLSSWAEQHSVSLRDASQLDTLTQGQCPQSRDRVLKAIGKTDFGNAF